MPHHRAKLTEAQARQLITDRNTLCECGRKPSYATLGKSYGITAVAAYKIISGKSWKHLAGLLNDPKIAASVNDKGGGRGA